MHNEATASDPVGSLDPATLTAAAAMWRQQRREISARFGGQSMLPTISAEHEVRIRCGEPARCGDVVLLLVSGRPVLHRVVHMTANGGVWTRGDNNVLPDGASAASAIVGVANAIRLGDEWREIPRHQPGVVANALLLFSRATRGVFLTALWRVRAQAFRLAQRSASRASGEGT